MKAPVFLLVALVIVVALGMVVGCAGAKPAAQLEKATLGISATSILPALVHIAEEQGYFLEEGIDLEVKDYPTGKAALTGVFDGEVDMGTVADTPIVFSSFERNDFAVFATILDSAHNVRALARGDRNIDTPQDLIGKRVATTFGTGAHFYMSLCFALNGLDATDVEVVDLKPGEAREALVNGDVDVIFAWEPIISTSRERLGGNAKILFGDVGFQQTFNLASMDDFIEKNPELLGKVIRALIKAEEYAKENREESIEYVAEHLKTGKESIDTLWDIYKFRVRLDQGLIVTMEDEARWAVQNGLIDETEMPNYLEYVYLDALDEVKPEAITIIR